MSFNFRAHSCRSSQEATDRKFALHTWDDVPINRARVVNVTLRFNDVLDPSKLHSSLERLLEIGDWRKLGARLRQKENGKLEYSVPLQFNAERPSLVSTYRKLDCDIEAHEVASKLPNAPIRPSVLNCPSEFLAVTQDVNTPRALQDYIVSDRPQLTLYIASFNNATLITLTWLHTLMDVMGLSSVLRSWTLVLAGQEGKVPPLLGLESDPLIEVGTSPIEEFVCKNNQLQSLGLYSFMLRHVWEGVWWPQEEQHMVCLPAKHLQTMKQNAHNELCQLYGAGEHFISDGDIIVAWWTRLVISCASLPLDRTVVIMNAFDLRNCISQEANIGTGAFVSNAASLLYTILTVREILSSPLGLMASKIRETIRQQGTRPQVEAYTAILRQSLNSTGFPPLFGSWNSRLIAFSNWTKAQMFEIDFSAATKRSTSPLDENIDTTVKPSYIQSYGPKSGMRRNGAFPIYGKDEQGNYWLSGFLHPSQWAKIKDAIDQR